MSSQAHAAERSNRYLNGVLTAIAALLGLLVAQGGVGLPGAQQALAQRTNAAATTGEGVINPADQRQMMISELRRMNEKLDRLAASLGKTPIDVNVVSMPNGAQAQAGE